MASYKKLVMWQKAMKVVITTYQLTKLLPKDERFGLISQMNRSAVSVPSNIAEGQYRGSSQDRKKFWEYAFASGAELETQLEIARQLYPNTDSKVTLVYNELEQVMKMLNVMIRQLKSKV